MAWDIGASQQNGWDIGAAQTSAAAPAPTRRVFVVSSILVWLASAVMLATRMAP